VIVHIMEGTGLRGTLPTQSTLLWSWHRMQAVPRVGECIRADDGRTLRVTDVLWVEAQTVQVYVSP
jgi:hypothetical protein